MKSKGMPGITTGFGNNIRVFQDNGGKLIVVPDSITMQDVVNELQTLKQSGEANCQTYRKSIIRHHHTRGKKDKIPTSWPCHPVDVDKESFVVLDYISPAFHA